MPLLFPGILLFAFLTIFLLYRRNVSIRRQIQPPAPGAISPVASQHFHLFQGGLLSDTAIAAVRNELEEMLGRGRVEDVEQSLRPGLDYIIRVRALAEIGTDAAGLVLERQLQRKLSDDPLEQCWYWIDLVHSLRLLNRVESLPRLLHCSEAILHQPLGSLFAAEMTCFPGFADHLSDPVSDNGRAATRILRQALEGIRSGMVSVQLYNDADLGELILRLTRSAPESTDPGIARVFLEILRHCRRVDHLLISAEEDTDSDALRWQMESLRCVEPIIREYLHGIGDDLVRVFPSVPSALQREILLTLAELRSGSVHRLLTELPHMLPEVRAAAFMAMTWSREPQVGWSLTDCGMSAFRTRRKGFFRRRFTQADAVYSLEEKQGLLYALRGHPGPAAEQILSEVLRNSEQPELRLSALHSLGWWEPIHREELVELVRQCCVEARIEIRRAAKAVLARLGNRRALDDLREALTGETPLLIHDMIDLIGEEGLSWLWPDLESLTESEEPAIAAHAAESVHRLREKILGPLG